MGQCLCRELFPRVGAAPTGAFKEPQHQILKLLGRAVDLLLGEVEDEIYLPVWVHHCTHACTAPRNGIGAVLPQALPQLLLVDRYDADGEFSSRKLYQEVVGTGGLSVLCDDLRAEAGLDRLQLLVTPPRLTGYPLAVGGTRRALGACPRLTASTAAHVDLPPKAHADS